MAIVWVLVGTDATPGRQGRARDKAAAVDKASSCG